MPQAPSMTYICLPSSSRDQELQRKLHHNRHPDLHHKLILHLPTILNFSFSKPHSSSTTKNSQDAQPPYPNLLPAHALRGRLRRTPLSSRPQQLHALRSWWRCCRVHRPGAGYHCLEYVSSQPSSLPFFLPYQYHSPTRGRDEATNITNTPRSRGSAIQPPGPE